ncbi:DUF4328 domain-containing protein [Luteolibacter soli]|uniref:DUF4328 domain-containing protein n=1 Tax=Luteolibacter soli TaxID=3135280 RepID=A0ABU9ATN0_9BACT
MPTDPENNPYLPPASDPTAPEAPANTTGGEPDSRIKDPRSWGWAAITFIWIFCLTLTLQWFTPPHPVWEAIVTLAIGISVTASVISYLGWLHLIITNAKTIHPGSKISHGWAIGSYFIPLVNWIFPPMIMKEIADATFRQRTPRALVYIVVVWWGSFVVSGLLRKFMPPSPLYTATIWIPGICVAWLIIRISLRQLDWRNEGLPVPLQPMVMPGSGPRPVAATRIPGPVNRPAPAENLPVIPDSETE